jgi:hypothetical protein
MDAAAAPAGPRALTARMAPLMDRSLGPDALAERTQLLVRWE